MDESLVEELTAVARKHNAALHVIGTNGAKCVYLRAEPLGSWTPTTGSPPMAPWSCYAHSACEALIDTVTWDHRIEEQYPGLCTARTLAGKALELKRKEERTE